MRMEFGKSMVIGQYYPVSSPVHCLDPRVKILLTLLLTVMVFFLDWILASLFLFFLLLVIASVAHLPARKLLSGLKPVLFLLILTGFLNLLFIKGKPLWSSGPLTVSKEGVYFTLLMVGRVMTLVLATTLLTLTTSPVEFTDGLERLLRPLSFMKVPAHDLAMMMSIALRFIPILLEEGDRIRKAQLSRGADLSSKVMVFRLKQLLPLLVPLFLSTLRRADDLAVAMEARGYAGGEGRTRMKELLLTWKDLLAIALTGGVFLLLVLLPSLFPQVVLLQ